MMSSKIFRIGNLCTIKRSLSNHAEFVQASPRGKSTLKKRVALFLGYCGNDYQGVQMNPGAKTIEADLFEGLIAAGTVSERNSRDPKLIKMVRAARTDKGVHALGQVISAKLLVKPNLGQDVNRFLPPAIRIFGWMLVPKGFKARQSCDARVYEYLMPTFVFQKSDIPPKMTDETAANAANELIQQSDEEADEDDKEDESDEDEDEDDKDEEEVKAAEKHTQILQRPIVKPFSEKKKWTVIDTPEDMVKRKEFRLPEKDLQGLRELLKKYEGTKNYHNFTTEKDFKDPSSKRYMISFEADQPFIIDGMEWICLRVKGASFMRAQIRKMIGFVIGIMRYDTDHNIFPLSFQQAKMAMAIAPGTGLLLKKACYDSYNQKMKRLNRRLIDLDEEGKQIQEDFKNQKIIPTIIQLENKEKSFLAFTQILHLNLHRYFSYFCKKAPTSFHKASLILHPSTTQSDHLAS